MSAVDIKREIADLRKAYEALNAIRKRRGWQAFEAAINFILPKIEAEEECEMKEAEAARQRLADAA